MNIFFAECTMPKSSEIEQGDVIEFFGKKKSEPNLGIIVTGDCDIDKCKFGKYLSYCHIYDLKTYFTEFFLRKRVEAQLTTLKQKSHKIVNDALKSKFVNFNKISDDNFEKFLHIYSDIELSDYVGIDPKQFKLVRLYKNISHKSNYTFDDFKSIIELLYKPKQQKEMVKSLQDKFCEAIKSLPGDKFFISSIIHRKEIGFVVELRRIAEIEINKISISTTDTDGKICKRICKLNSPYKEKLTQKIASMFSDIGLSSDYEDNIKYANEFLFAELQEKNESNSIY